MLRTYRAVFRAPGSAAFCSAGFVMRMPIAIYPIGLVLLISTRTGHYGFAGLLSGAYVIANGLGNPSLARLVDRHGQSRMLLPASAVHLAAVAAICVLAQSHSPQWTLIAPTIVAGFAYLSVGSLVRARWSTVLAGRPELTTAYSLESTLDEVIFTVGPLIATVIATQVNAVLGLALGGVLVGAGAVWLRRQRDTEPAPHAVGSPRHRSAVRYPGMGLILVAAFGMGGVFASAEVTMVAYCGQHDATAASGLMLAALRVRQWRSRFCLRGENLAVLDASPIPAAGAGIRRAAGAFPRRGEHPGARPLRIRGRPGYRPDADHRVRAGRRDRARTRADRGHGVADHRRVHRLRRRSAVVGRIADAHGARVAFSVTIGCGLLVGIVALLLHKALDRPPDDPAPSPDRATLSGLAP